MDITKFALYTSLAIITYLMLLAWQEDYPPTIDDGSASRVELPRVSNVENTDALEDDVPSTSLSKAPVSTSADTPSVAPASNTSSTNEIISKELISVHTDTFEVQINPVGGDCLPCLASLP